MVICTMTHTLNKRAGAAAQCLLELIAPGLRNLGQHDIGVAAFGSVSSHSAQQLLTGRHKRPPLYLFAATRAAWFASAVRIAM